jgi:DNA-binding XRE family transcriptional regulator
MVQHISGTKLRQLRRSATPKLSQQELADRLGLRRETVNKIENDHQATIRAIKVEVLLNWYEICGARAPRSARQDFVHYIRSLWVE